jgi:hypothetical protein
MPVTPLRFDTASSTGRVMINVTAVLSDRHEVDTLATRYGETVNWETPAARGWPATERGSTNAEAFVAMGSARNDLVEAIAEYRRRGGSEETIRECLEGLLWLVERQRPDRQDA